MNGEEGRRPAPGGRGRSGWADACGCDGRWSGCRRVRVLGSASLRVGAVGRRRASSGVGSISVGGVAGACGARVRGAAVGTAWRRHVASCSRSLFFARRRRRVRQCAETEPEQFSVT
jgi:hypothetical protein